MFLRQLPATSRGQLAASLSATLLAEQQGPEDPRLRPYVGLRASTFCLSSVVYSEELYLRRQRLHLAFERQRPWLILLLQGDLAIDLDDGDTPLFLRSGQASVLLTSALDQQCTVFTAPTRLIRIGFDSACCWTRHGLIHIDALPLLQRMIQLLRDSNNLDSGSKTTDGLSLAIRRYVLEVLEPFGVELNIASSDPLQILLDWLPHHLDEKLRLDDLASVARVSPRHLQLLCQDRFGSTPMDLLRQHRLDAFYQDLSDSKSSVKGISQLLNRWNLPDSKATRSAFMERFGQSPSELRRRLLKRSAK